MKNHVYTYTTNGIAITLQKLQYNLFKVIQIHYSKGSARLLG